MPYVLKAIDPNRVVGQYLEWFDVDVHAPGQPYPTGAAGFTPIVERALHFETLQDALETWNRQSTTVPLRQDGKPNKPLTAFSMEIMPFEVLPMNEEEIEPCSASF